MAVTVLEAAQVPGVFQKAFHLMRSGRPGPVLIDLPFDVQMTEIEFDPETYAPLEPHRPAATRAQVEKALDMLQDAGRAADRRRWRDHQRRRVRPARRAGRAAGRAGHADPDGLGRHPRRPPPDGGDGGAADLAPVRQRHVPGVGLRARHRQPLGQPAHRRAGPLPARPEVRARRHRAHADRPGVPAGLRDRVRRGRGAGAVRRGGPGAQGGGPAPGLRRVGRASAPSASSRCCAARTSTTCR